MRNHCRSALVLFVALSILAPVVVRGQFGFLRGSKSDFQTFSDPAGRFQLEYPKDWQPTAGIGDVLVTFAQKKSEAALVVERFHLNQALGEINELFGQIEMDTLKERQPQATGVSFKVVGSKGLAVVMIDYSRPGLAGQEQARQYSFPIGQELYRLNCSAMMALFAKYDPVFLHIAGSFTTTAATPNAPPALKAGQGRPK